MRLALVNSGLLLAACAHAPFTVVQVKTVAARPEDVQSLDGLMRAFYEVVNVAPDAPRQWSRDRTLYSPWIRFVGLGHWTGGRPELDVWTHQQLVDETEPMVGSGFREWEVHRTQRRYANIVHLDSTYEGEVGLQKKRFRGVNSIEAYFDGARWWISSVMWQSEDASHPLPAELLAPP